MASTVEICNSALSHLGDSAAVTSISPPDGTAQARHCAQWFPIARQRMLTYHHWSFATRRIALAELTNPDDAWEHTYAAPVNALDVWWVGAEGSSADSSPFEQEILASGAKVIRTNVENAFAKYTHDVTDTTKFSPGATDALEWLLASLIAGPIIKGDAGRKSAQACSQMYGSVRATAAAADAQAQQKPLEHTPVWLGGR